MHVTMANDDAELISGSESSGGVATALSGYAFPPLAAHLASHSVLLGWNANALMTLMFGSYFICRLGSAYYLLKAGLLAWLVLPQTKVHHQKSSASATFSCSPPLRLQLVAISGDAL